MTRNKLLPSEKKVIFLASLGGGLEFYDFIIYVIFAPVLGQIFFPETDTLATLMSVYVIYAIGYLVRPLGGIIFSHFGDTKGRKKTFALTVMLMAVPTFIIGLLPTYQHVGITASIALAVLRILQGLSIGGEMPGAITFIGEHVPRQKRGLACGILIACLNIGIFLGSAVSLLLNSILTEAQLAAFGWRIPFIFGGLLGIVSFYIRKQVAESPLFVAQQNKKTNAQPPLLEFILSHKLRMLQGIGVILLCAVVINLFFLYLPTYLSTVLAYSKEQAMFSNTLTLFLSTALFIVFGYFADKFGGSFIVLLGAVGFAILGYFLFALFAQQTPFALYSGMFIVGILLSVVASYPSILVDLFPVSVRYTGIAVCYNVAYAFFGGLTPLLVTVLIKYYGKFAPVGYLVGCAIICAFACISVSKCSKEKLRH